MTRDDFAGTQILDLPITSNLNAPRRRYGHCNHPSGAHIQAMHDARTQLCRIGQGAELGRGETQVMQHTIHLKQKVIPWVSEDK